MRANIAISIHPAPGRFAARLAAQCGVVLLLLAGCGEQPQARPFGTPVTGPGRPGVALQDLIEGAMRPPLGTARPAVLDSLDLPNRTGVEPRRRPGARQADTLRTLYYDGLEVSTYRITRSGKELITGATVTDSTYKTREGLHVGSLRAEVEATLGPPEARLDSTYTYRLSESSRLYVRFVQDHVTELQWRFFEK